MNNQSFGIDDLTQLKWLFAVLIAAALFTYAFAMRRRALAAFAELRFWSILAPDLSRPRAWLKAALILAAMTSIVAALLGPRYGIYWEDVQQRQLDLVVCLDVSRSMLAEDEGMSRLSRAKDDIKQLLDRLAGSMIGIVAFAGRADLVCPLTDDYEFVRLTLDDIGPHSAQLGGTNIGDAITAATKAFGDDRRPRRAIIVMTDGEDLGDKALQAARDAHQQGMTVYAIGIGDADKGALIPIQQDGRRTFLMYDGQQHWSKADPEKLRTIAAAGGGEYHPSRLVSEGQRTLEWLYAAKMAPQAERSMQQKRIQRKYARFHWPAALALILLVIEPFISERKPQPAIPT